MHITLLGTSHGDGTASRFQSSTLLESGGRYYLIDAGEPVDTLLVRQNVIAAQISAVFITHMHLDHTGGLPNLIEHMFKYRSRFPEIVPVCCLPDADAIDALEAWNRANGIGKVPRLVPYDSDWHYEDGTLQVQAVRSGHLKNHKSYSLIVQAEGRKLVFSGDLASTFDFPLNESQDADCVFCELVHFPFELALPTLKKLRTSRLVFVHMSDPCQTAEGASHVLATCRKELPYPVEFAADGDRIAL
ncbi:MAG: MBL fold metallo-hydrolase [Victivallaceae bacterium]|nr:MBL fold metallo-hydrolase [Victivallaceae bacterium]